ncbi:protein CHUP1, chloroplastic [Tanacetum coccineum]
MLHLHVEKYGQLLNFLIREVQSAAFTEISDVEVFVKWLDGELSCLVDERAVLKHFPQWPERKADALREAAFSFRDLKNLESEVLAFKCGPKQPLVQSLRKMQALQDRQVELDYKLETYMVESSVSGLERTREGTSKRYKELQIPWQWLMDTGVVGQIKLSSLKLARECMRRIAKELETNEASRDGDLLLQGVRFAFRVHQFAGGFDTDTMHAFEELKEIGSKHFLSLFELNKSEECVPGAAPGGGMTVACHVQNPTNRENDAPAVCLSEHDGLYLILRCRAMFYGIIPESQSAASQLTSDKWCEGCGSLDALQVMLLGGTA